MQAHRISINAASRSLKIVSRNLVLAFTVPLPFVLQDDGGIEYFNTIVVQPHLKLVTNQGRGFHVRCRYQTRDKVVTNDQTHVSMLPYLPLQVIEPGDIIFPLWKDPFITHPLERISRCRLHFLKTHLASRYGDLAHGVFATYLRVIGMP
jgi:hypothetical protein